MDSQTRGLRLLDTVSLKRLLHTGVSLVSFLCVLYASGKTLANMNNRKIVHLEFMQHGKRNVPFFFTLWLVASHITYYYMYTAIDIIEVYYNNNKKLLRLTKRIHLVASYLLFTIIFPLGWFVLVAFWGAFLWDRESMYPSEMDELLPPWVNHMMHTAPVPVSFVYMFTSNRHVPPKLTTATGMIAFMCIYWSLFISVKAVTGEWVYLFFNRFRMDHMPIIISSSILVAIFFHRIGYKVNDSLKGVKASLSFIVGS